MYLSHIAAPGFLIVLCCLLITVDPFLLCVIQQLLMCYMKYTQRDAVHDN